MAFSVFGGVQPAKSSVAPDKAEILIVDQFDANHTIEFNADGSINNSTLDLQKDSVFRLGYAENNLTKLMFSPDQSVELHDGAEHVVNYQFEGETTLLQPEDITLKKLQELADTTCCIIAVKPSGLASIGDDADLTSYGSSITAANVHYMVSNVGFKPAKEETFGDVRKIVLPFTKKDMNTLYDGVLENLAITLS